MTDERHTEPNRRRFLQLGGSALALTLAGCTGSGDSGASPVTDEAMADAEMDDTDMTEDEMTGDSMDDSGMTDESMNDSETTADGMDGSMATTFRVRIENVSTESTLRTMGETMAVPLSPGAYVVHSAPNALFAEGEPASGGLERVAEDGMPGELVASFDEMGMDTDMDAVHGGAFDTPVGASSPGPLTPGDAYEFEFEATTDAHLSFATMFIPSNDLFFAPEPAGIALFADGEPVDSDVTAQVALWDAGTEVNEEPGTGPNQAPRQSGANTGEAENGTVRRIDDVDDGFTYPAVSDVLRVTVTPTAMN